MSGNMLSDQEIRERTARILASRPAEQSQVIPILQDIQHEFGYLPPAAMAGAATHLGMSDVQVFGVASFYNHFRFTPLGRHPVQMCMGTACHMVGGSLVLEALERSLKIDVGGVSEDGEFSLDRVACVGCCGLAPVMLIGEKIHAKVTPTKVDEIMVNLKMEEEARKAEESGDGD